MRERVTAAALALALLGYSNGLAIRALRRGAVADAAYVRSNGPFLVVLVGALAAVRGVGPDGLLREAGVQRAGGGRSLVGGPLVGGLLATPALLFFARPVVLRQPLVYDPIAGLSRGALRRRIWLELPLTVALFEEIAFRGLLDQAWRRAGWPQPGLATSLAFAGWHWAVSVDTMRRTNIAAQATRVPRVLRRHANAVGVGGGLLATAVVGLALTALRRWCGGNLLGPVLAHWIADALLVLALHRRREP